MGQHKYSSKEIKFYDEDEKYGSVEIALMRKSFELNDGDPVAYPQHCFAFGICTTCYTCMRNIQDTRMSRFLQ